MKLKKIGKESFCNEQDSEFHHRDWYDLVLIRGGDWIIANQLIAIYYKR